MFDCGNADELADKIASAAENQTLMSSAADANRSLVVEKADRKKNLLSLEQWYYNILNR